MLYHNKFICFYPTHLALSSNEETVGDCDVGNIGGIGVDVDWRGEGVVYGDGVRCALTNLYREVDDICYSRRGGFEMNMVVLVFL